MSNLGAPTESPSSTRLRSAGSRNDKMENNRSPRPSSFLGTQYPNSSQPSGMTDSGMLAATGSGGLEDPSFGPRSSIGTLPMEHPQPNLTIWNQPSSQDLPNILGDGAQVNPMLEYDMVPKTYAEPQFPIYGTDMSTNSFALHSFIGHGNPLLSPQAASTPVTPNALQFGQNPLALSNSAYLEPSRPPSITSQKRKHNHDYGPEGSRGGSRGQGSHLPRLKVPRNASTATIDSASSMNWRLEDKELFRLDFNEHGTHRRGQKAARKASTATRDSASLMKWWVNDKELIQLDFEEHGQQISCPTRCYRRDIRSLVDLKWAQEKRLECHPVPRPQRKRIKTPWGDKTPEAYCVMNLMHPVGSKMTYKKLEVLAIPLYDEVAKVILGRDTSIKLGLHTIDEDEDKKIEEEMGSFETSTIGSTPSRPSTSTFLNSDSDDFLTPGQSVWGFKPPPRF